MTDCDVTFVGSRRRQPARDPSIPELNDPGPSRTIPKAIGIIEFSAQSTPRLVIG